MTVSTSEEEEQRETYQITAQLQCRRGCSEERFLHSDDHHLGNLSVSAPESFFFFFFFVGSGQIKSTRNLESTQQETGKKKQKQRNKRKPAD